MTQGGTLMGSLQYMSPEQMLGRSIDHRSDIFSVGSLAYELVTYQQAFKGSLNDGLLQRLPYEDPPPLHEAAPDVPWAIEEIIMRALQKAPENRFQDLAEMRSALLAAQQASPPPVVRPSEDDRTIVIPRGAVPQADAPLGPATPPSPFMPPPPASSAPPSAFVPPPAPPSAAHRLPTGTGASAGTEAPAMPTWQVKKKGDTVGTPVKTPVKTNAEARTGPTVHKTSTTRPATMHPETAPRASGRRWALVGAAAVILLAGAAAAVPWLTAEPPNPLEREQPGIEAAIEQYRIAYRNRDLPAVAAAFPALPQGLRQTMERTFENCLVYEVVFDQMQVRLTGDGEAAAEVTLRSTHTCTPQSGGRQTTATQDETYVLRKNGGAWIINGVKSAARRQ